MFYLGWFRKWMQNLNCLPSRIFFGFVGFVFKLNFKCVINQSLYVLVQSREEFSSFFSDSHLSFIYYFGSQFCSFFKLSIFELDNNKNKVKVSDTGLQFYTGEAFVPYRTRISKKFSVASSQENICY